MQLEAVDQGVSRLETPPKETIVSHSQSARIPGRSGPSGRSISTNNRKTQICNRRLICAFDQSIPAPSLSPRDLGRSEVINFILDLPIITKTGGGTCPTLQLYKTLPGAQWPKGLWLRLRVTRVHNTRDNKSPHILMHLTRGLSVRTAP